MEKIVKHCPGCNRILPVKDFYSNKGKPDGLSSYCKDCIKKRNRKSYKNIHSSMCKSVPVPIDEAKDLNLKIKTLKDYSPRELLAELKSRGYVWDNMYVKQFVNYQSI